MLLLLYQQYFIILSSHVYIPNIFFCAPFVRVNAYSQYYAKKFSANQFNRCQHRFALFKFWKFILQTKYEIENKQEFILSVRKACGNSERTVI